MRLIKVKGENFVRLKGKIKNPDVSRVGEHSSILFKASLAIPDVRKRGYQYVKIASFSCAEALGELPEGTFIEAHGHIEERSYQGKCRHCGGFDKKYWTEVQIDYFKVIEI